MPKKNIIVGILAIIALGIVFFVSTKKTDTTTEQTTLTQSNITSETPQTLKELLVQRTPVQCTFGGDAGGMNISGTVYVGDGKIRGDYTMTGPMIPNGMQTYMIIDSASMRYWTSASTQGFKTAIDPETMEPTKTNSTQTMNYNQDFEYACTSWTVDAGKFTPPSTISFTDLNSSGTAVGGNTMTGSKTQQCGACDLIPDASAKAQCRATMQCN